MPGRESEFTQECADLICDRLMSGESLRAICRDDNMPTAVQVIKWLEEQPHFAKQYARAREVQADTIFDECLDIADKTVIGMKKITKSTGVEIIECDMTEHRRLQIDTRKWMAGKMRPKKYNDRYVDALAQAEANAEGGGRNEVNIRVTGGYVEAFEKPGE